MSRRAVREPNGGRREPIGRRNAASAAAHNLPEPVASFVGRERDVRELSRELDSQRLVTLTGTGGVGKTRLALELARRRVSRYPDGVWLIDLAPVPEPVRVLHAVAAGLGVLEGPARPLAEALQLFLRNRELLLVLDNCEHVVDACARLVDTLLAGCPSLSVLCTSREALGITGERIRPLAPLTTLPSDVSDPRQQRAIDSVQLFADRARAARPDFELSDEVAPTVAEITRQLDGIPLAIELAAARLRTNSLDEIRGATHDRFRLLTHGVRTVIPRHRTMRAAIDWSYDLLSESERSVFRSVGVFAGGFTLESAQRVCDESVRPASDVESVLGSLVERSLIEIDDWRHTDRYRMLETIRAYSLERLEESGEAASICQRHQAWCIELLEWAAARVWTAEQPLVFRRFDAEMPNIRVALDGCVETPGFPERALRAWFGLWGYVNSRAIGSEDRARLQRLLDAAAASGPTEGQAVGLAMLAYRDTYAGDLDAAATAIVEAQRIAERLDSHHARGWAQIMAGLHAVVRGDLEAAASAHVRGLELSEQAPHELIPAVWRHCLGTIRILQGSLDEAGRLFQAALSETTSPTEKALTISGLALLAQAQGATRHALEQYQEALRLGQTVDAVIGYVHSVTGVATVAVATQQYERTARLLGIVQSIMDRASMLLVPIWQPTREQAHQIALAELGDERFHRQYQEGRALSMDRALQYALETDVEPPETRAARARPDELTERELEVARAVARGLTNRAIGEELIISKKTVDAHLRHVLRKLEATRRSQIAQWVTEQKIN
jgi:predicted ATPase/DNA-binding CsgD family transcriptional regulator